MATCTCKPTLSAAVLGFVWGYKPRFRDLTLKFLQEKLAERPNLRIEDVQECIAMAYNVFLEDVNRQVPIPEPDPSTMTAAIEEYRAGKHRTIQEFVDAVS